MIQQYQNKIIGNALPPPVFDNGIFSDIISLQLKRWKQEGKTGMRLYIRSHEKCFDCGLHFKEANNFYCGTHKRHAFKVFIEVSGIKDPEYPGQVRIYSDPDGNLLHVHTVFATKEKMKQEIVGKTFNIRRYLPRNKKSFIFENYADKYLSHVERRGRLNPGDKDWLSSTHVRDIKCAFKNHLRPYFKDYDIADINTGIVDDFLIFKPFSNHQKRKLPGYLKAMLNWAKRRGDMTDVPEIVAIKLIRKKKKGLTTEIQGEILKHVPEPYKPILRWAAETGRRINEYRALKIKDINFSKSVYEVNGAFDGERYKEFPKVPGHAGEEFPLTCECKDILNVALKDRIYGPDDFVFLNRERPYTDNSIRRIFERARKKAGYRVTLNEFGRHSMGLQLRQAGATYSDIADILGNTVEIAKKNYSHCEAVSKAKILELREKISHGEEAETAGGKHKKVMGKSWPKNHLHNLPFLLPFLVEQKGIEPSTSALRTLRSPI